MAISSVDTTNIKRVCDLCGTEDTIAVSGLEAGTDAARGASMIDLGTCSGCSAHHWISRTWDNPTKEAGAVNGLHAYLVAQDQINAAHTGTLRGTVDTDTFTGSGLDDATHGGYYLGAADCTYTVEIESTGTPDVIKWRKDAGSWTTGVNITGSAQALGSEGVEITFAATTGHTLGDLWDLDCTAEADKPVLHYTPTGSPVTYDTGTTNGYFPVDLDNVITVLGTAETKNWIAGGILYTDDDNTKIATLVTALYSTTAERTAATSKITEKRLLEFLV